MNRRDEAIVDDTKAERALQCTAAGCPNRWAVDAGSGKLCSAHAWRDPRDWPRITQQLVDDETERAYRAGMDTQPMEPRAPLTREQKASLGQRIRAALQRMRDLAGGSRQWAHRLKAREQGGEKLTSAQRDMWRAAVHETGPDQTDASRAHLADTEAAA